MEKGGDKSSSYSRLGKKSEREFQGGELVSGPTPPTWGGKGPCGTALCQERQLLPAPQNLVQKGGGQKKSTGLQLTEQHKDGVEAKNRLQRKDDSDKNGVWVKGGSS